MSLSFPEELFTRLSECRIAVIGDFCLDAYWEADMRLSELSRETPHYPLPIVSERLSLGGAGNVAANVLALAPARVSCVGVVGADWRGRALLDLLREQGADVSGMMVDETRQTNAYIKPLRRGMSEVVYEDPRLDFANYTPLSVQTETALLSALERLGTEVDVICVSDQLVHGCVTASVRQRLMALGGSGVRVIVDSRDRIGLYSQVMIKPNELEACRALDLPDEADEATLKTGAMRLANRTGRPCVITRGEYGCLVAEGGQVTVVPACAVRGEIDFCGAGDTFLSALASMLAAGATSVQAAAVACVASSVTIRKLKTTGTATREEIAQAWAGYDG